MGTTQADLAHALRRIDKLEAAQRRVLRSLSRCTPGSGLARDLARQLSELGEQLAHWRTVVSRAEGDGFRVWSRDDFTPGDFVEYRGSWHTVLRVNLRSVTVPCTRGGTGADGTQTLGYHDGITGRRGADDAPPES